MIPDAIGAVGGFTYVALLLWALVIVGRTNPSLRRLTTAIKIYAVAFAVETVVLVAHLADMADDGPLEVVLSIVTLVLCAFLWRQTWKRREVAGERLVAEAERTVREWRDGAL